jgi:hypothetical protein
MISGSDIPATNARCKEQRHLERVESAVAVRVALCEQHMAERLYRALIGKAKSLW